jgi:hypothetical protein
MTIIDRFVNVQEGRMALTSTSRVSQHVFSTCTNKHTSEPWTATYLASIDWTLVSGIFLMSLFYTKLRLMLQ